MSKTTTQKVQHDPKKDLTRMKKLMGTYAELLNEKEKMQEKLAPIVESLKAAEEEMATISARNPKAFDKKDNWEIGDKGYVHTSYTSEVITKRKFSMPEFVKNFPGFVNTTFKIAEVKKAMLGADTRKPFTDAGVDIKMNKGYKFIVRSNPK